MKRLFALLAAALMLFAALPAPALNGAPRTDDISAPYLEGYCIGDGTGNLTAHWVGFSADAPAEVTSLSSGFTTYAAAYCRGKVYGYVYGYDSQGELRDDFYVMDARTHFTEFPEGASSGGEFVYGMAFDHTTGTMYALCNEDHPYIASVDLATGALTRVVNINLGSALGVQTFAIDDAGDFYVLTFSAVSSKLMRVNRNTGAMTQVIDTGLACFYAQSMTYDPSTRLIYWAHSAESTSSENGLYALDIEAQTISPLGMIGDGIELMCLFTPYDPEPILGDVNFDGTVDTADALLALRWTMSLIELDGYSLMAADVNCDGSIDTADALLILRFALGIIDSF
ncbi:MAG: hypothetical protein J5586_07415 [Clostridia bacterium]|nr:hypothetical protein [Clostridia bacterium]